MTGRLQLLGSCAAIALAGYATVAAAQTQQSNSAATTAAQAASGGQTADQAQRSQATSQNTEATSATTIGELVITAQSHEQTLQRTPIAVSAYTDERRNLVGIETESDIVNFTPSMSLNGQFLSLRGVGRYTNELGTDPGVAVFVDGIYTPSPDYLNQPDFLTDRIEVMRGPQGTLGGQNDIGGSVNVIEKRPTDAFHAEGRMGLNNYLYWYTQAAVSGPIADHLDFRIADAYAYQPPGYGFVKNLSHPNQHPGAGFSNLFEGQLEWKPTESFDAWFKLQDFQSDTAATYGVNPDEYPVYPPGSAFGGNCPTVNGVPFSCLAPAPTALLPPASNPTIYNRNLINVNTVGHTKLHDDWTFTTHLTYTMPWASLEYIGGYSQYNYIYNSDFDGGPTSPAVGALPAGFIDQTVFGNQWQKWYQNELQLKSPSDQRLKWLVGVFQYWNSYSAPYNEAEPNNFALDVPTIVNAAGMTVPGPPNPNRDFYGQVGNLTDKAEAIYANVDYDLTDTLRLTGGLRYNWDHKDGNVHFIEVFDTAGIFFSPGLGSSYVTNQFNTAHVSSSDWTGKIGAEWRPDSSTMVYGSVSKGFKSAGMALADFTPVPVVAPETLYDFEGGVKKTFGSQFLVDADVYYYDYHNLQQFLSALNPTTSLISSTLVSAQRARTYGFELESVWSPTTDFQLTFNYSYMNARFTKFEGGFLDSSQLAPGCVGNGSPPPKLPVGAPNPNACNGIFHTSLAGNAIPQSPANKVTINPVYTLHFDVGKLTLSGTYAFIDKQYYSVFSTPNFLAPAYSNVDLRLLFQPTHTPLTFVLYARNVTDSRQIVNYSTGYFVYGPANLVVPPAGFPSRGQVTYFVNAPRTIGGEVQFRF